MTIEHQPPIATALRIAGCAMVCATHSDCTEFGYPLLCAAGSGMVRRSTGVVYEDGSFGPSTCDTWIVDERGRLAAITEAEVREWSANKAWRYRMSELRYAAVGKTAFCVFELPCRVFGFFRIPFHTNPLVFEPVEFKPYNSPDTAIAWCNNEVHKAGQQERDDTRSRAGRRKATR
jgi:hypothetical protein